MLETDARFKVIGSASDGNEAQILVKELKPDVITMDVEMPVMDGITAVKKIMSFRPTPILMFSSLTREGAQATLDALEAGAVDYLPKKFEDISNNQDEVAKVLRSRVWGIGIRGLPRKVSRIEPVSVGQVAVNAGKKSNAARYQPDNAIAGVSKIRGLELVAIGASTGGPVALQAVLQGLPANYPVPIFLIQHMPPSFTAAFASRLNKQCNIEVREAGDGDILKPGCALLAPGGKQAVVTAKKGELVVNIEAGDPGLTYKPSIDLAYKSIASAISNKCLAVILTGMGADGREGARLLKSKGSVIWAQDEATSVIYGMPMAIKKAGLADQEFSLEQFTPALQKVV